MAGRINPHEYDLGELRDAADERTRNEDLEGRTNGKERRPAERRELGRDRPAELTGRETARVRTGRTHGSVTENPETYLQARNRRVASPEADFRTGSTPKQRSRQPSRNRDRTGRETEDVRRESSRGAGRSGGGLELLSYRSGGNVSRPYLDTVPGTFGAQQEVFEWLEFLVSRAGMDGARSALEYYEAVEWISAESRAELEQFVDGINARSETDGSLGVSDHRESLVYVARLASRHG